MLNSYNALGMLLDTSIYKDSTIETSWTPKSTGPSVCEKRRLPNGFPHENSGVPGK